MKNRSIVLVWAICAVLAAPTMGLANPKSSEPVVSTVRAQVAKTEVSVRKTPGGKEVAVAKKGAIVAVLSTSEGWANVRFSDGVTGWIHKSMLMFPEGEKPKVVEANAAPSLPPTAPVESALPETPTRIVSDVSQPKRLSISISDGKASIRHVDGTTKEERVERNSAPQAPTTPLEPVTRTGTVLPAKSLDLSAQDRVALPPLETPRFAPAPKAVKSSEAAPLKADATGSAATILDKAASMKGIFYRYGGEGSRGGWDCSAFVRHCFSVGADIKLPRTAMEQYSRGVAVSKSELQPGDLVFFSSRISRVGHVGIYWGDGKFIHCSSGKNGVAISGLDESYYASHYVGAKRILSGTQKLKGPVPLPDTASGETN